MKPDLLAGNNIGINCDETQLVNGQCSLNIYETIGIREELSPDDRSSFDVFINDIILWATFFIGTIVTISLIVSGLMFVFAGADEKAADTGKKGIKYSLIGLLLVIFSYSLIRLLQFLVQGG